MVNLFRFSQSGEGGDNKVAYLENHDNSEREELMIPTDGVK